MSDSPAVKLWRDTFKFNLNLGFKRDIEVTVKDLQLWKEILTNWGYWKNGKWIKFSPLNVKGMLSEYERRAQHGQRPHAAVGNQRERSQVTSETRVPEGRIRGMRDVWKDEGLHARRDNQTLEETLTQALRKTYRPEAELNRD